LPAPRAYTRQAVARSASIGEARRRLPRDFVESLQETFPQPIAESILRGMSARRPTSMRVNTLRMSSAALLRFYRENAVKHRRVPWYEDAFVLPELRERDVERWTLYGEGRIYLQSLSSMIPALALSPRPGERVLDLTAAPGSKTTQMAALMGNQGSIVANEIDPVRAERLAFNIRVQGCEIVEIRVGRGERLGEELPESFDRVLLDAPCSGEGRFAVHAPQTFRSWSPRTVAQCARLQKKLFASAVRALKVGGILVYSTCTLNREENEGVVRWALEALPIAVEKCPIAVPGAYAGLTRGLDERVGNALRIFPDAEREGFFVCRIRKKEE